jgi:hypothetical protein
MDIDNKYQHGKIYTIRSFQTDKFYIGSTTQPLSKRLYEHKKRYKSFNRDKSHYVSSYDMIKYQDCYIELLEEHKCDNRSQLDKREGELIRLHKGKCINKNIAGRSYKEYYADNKEIKRQYYLDNKEKRNLYQKQYYQDNKKRLNQHTICDCGGKYLLVNKLRHETCKKHQSFINATN